MRAFILRPAVAKGVGVKTATIRVWDRLGKGPPGRFRLSRTQVAYDAEACEEWIRSLRERSDSIDVPTPPAPRRRGSRSALADSTKGRSVHPDGTSSDPGGQP